VTRAGERENGDMLSGRVGCGGLVESWERYAVCIRAEGLWLRHVSRDSEAAYVDIIDCVTKDDGQICYYTPCVRNLCRLVRDIYTLPIDACSIHWSIFVARAASPR
jgi:hypothetical protein